MFDESKITTKTEKFNHTYCPDKKIELEYADKESVLAFANYIREKGNAGLLTSLLPSEQRVPEHCLIANAVNFNSFVDATGKYWDHVPDSPNSVWGMYPVPNGINQSDYADAKQKIQDLAEKTGLEYVEESNSYETGYIKLPKFIGNAAYAFDLGAEEFKEFTI